MNVGVSKTSRFYTESMCDSLDGLLQQMLSDVGLKFVSATATQFFLRQCGNTWGSDGSSKKPGWLDRGGGRNIWPKN